MASWPDSSPGQGSHAACHRRDKYGIEALLVMRRLSAAYSVRSPSGEAQAGPRYLTFGTPPELSALGRIGTRIQSFRLSDNATNRAGGSGDEKGDHPQ